MDIDRVLKNSRLVHAITGVSGKGFLSPLTTFTGVLLEVQSGKKRKRSVGDGRIRKINPGKIRSSSYFGTSSYTQPMCCCTCLCLFKDEDAHMGTLYSLYSRRH